MRDKVTELLVEARTLLWEERNGGQGSREQETTLTNLDTAILWRREDLWVKSPPMARKYQIQGDNK